MKKIQLNSSFWLLLLLLVVALASRWFAIDRFGLWSDELGSVFYSSSIEQTTQDIHTPFFYFLTYLAQRAYGINEFAMRLSSLLASSFLLIFLFGQAVRKTQPRWTWFFVLFSFSGLDWALSREARMYEWMVLLSTLSFLSGCKFSSSPRPRNWWPLTFFMALNGFNHVSALIFNASCVLYWTIRKKTLALGKVSLSSSFFLSSLPVLLYYLSGERLGHALGRIHWVAAMTRSWPWDLWRHLMGAKHPYLEFQHDIYPLALLLSFFVIVSVGLWRKSSLSWTAPLAIIFFYHMGQLALYPFLNLFHIRYFSILLPIVLWVFALGLERVLKTKKLHILCIVSFLLIVQVLGLKSYAPQAGLREFYQSELGPAPSQSFDEQVVVCDYALMRKSQQIFYPFLFDDVVYCYNFPHYYFKKSPAPKSLKVISSLNYSEDFKAIEAFLEQDYTLKKVESAPGGAGRVWYYARR